MDDFEQRFYDNFNTELTEQEEEQYIKWVQEQSELRGRDVAKEKT